jgi:predicted aconitase
LTNYTMNLTDEEKQILQGDQGETMRKALETLVLYGQTFEAESLVSIDHAIHAVMSVGIPLLTPVYDLIDELIENKLKTDKPFTVDPRPMDFKNVKSSFLEKFIFKKVMYGFQEQYEKKLQQIGLKDEKSFSCTCYLEEVGNIPSRGATLAWAESSAVVYANSVLGARTNRNSGIMEMLSGITGKTPLFGLLTDEGRKADWLIEIKTELLPEAQLLGSAIGMKVMEDVPYITNIDRFLGTEITESVRDYLKDMGAASASNGAVGLYHVENVTPEAKDMGRSLLNQNYKTYVIDDDEIQRIYKTYPVMWKKRDQKPKMAFIGCPHLSFNQLNEWLERIEKGLQKSGRKKMTIPVVLTAAPEVLERLKKTDNLYERFLNTGASLSSICGLMYMNNPLSSRKPVITNSNKLRTYTSCRYYTDAEISNIITGVSNERI